MKEVLLQKWLSFLEEVFACPNQSVFPALCSLLKPIPSSMTSPGLYHIQRAANIYLPTVVFADCSIPH